MPVNVPAAAVELFQKHKQTLDLLSGIGVRDSDLQKTVRGAVFDASAGWASATAADLENAAVSEYFRVLMPREEFPQLCKLYVQAANAEGHHLGKERAGNQIDAFPDSGQERVRATSAIERNAGYKKAASQRDADKAKNAAKAKAKAQGGGKGKGQKAQETSAATSASSLPFTLPDKTPVAHDAAKDARMKKVFDALSFLKIEHEFCEHPPVPTVEDMMAHLGSKPGAKCKNLFLKASKPEAYWLVVALHDTQVDVKALSKKVGAKKPMRFTTVDVTASMLGGNKGDLSPFNLVNDAAGKVNVAVDQKLLEAEGGAWFHPLSNEASIRVSAKDLLRFIEATGHEVMKF